MSDSSDTSDSDSGDSSDSTDSDSSVSSDTDREQNNIAINPRFPWWPLWLFKHTSLHVSFL